jgi:hypothetical protein
MSCIAGMTAFRRMLRRAERASDKLRFRRHNCELQLRACPPWHKADRERLERRYADLSSRLALVDCICVLAGAP